MIRPYVGALLIAYFVLWSPRVLPLQAEDPVAAAPADGQFLKHWYLLGPIAIDVDQDATQDPAALEAEFAVDFLQGDGGEATAGPGQAATQHGQWQECVSENSAIDLGQVLGESEWSVAYAANAVEVAEAGKAILGVGSDDAVKVWLNGELVHTNWIGRPHAEDDDVIPVQLRAGKNQLLLKVMNWEADWSFSCRFLDDAAQATQLVNAAARRDEERIKDMLAAGVDINAADEMGGTPWLAAKVKGNDKIARMLEVLGANTDVEFDSSRFVERFLERRATRQRPGIAVLIAKGDDVLYSEGFGDASIEHDVAVSTQTKFRIGSVSKQFTAAAILKLQEAGKLQVEDRLSKFFPDFPRGDEVTLHHLLTHTSGLKNFTSRPDFFESVASHIDAEEMIESFYDDGFDFDPGEKFAYCNTGYFLLGQIVEQVSGQTFEEYLKTAFFDPLEMSDTGVHDSRRVYKHEATGYSIEGDDVAKALDWDMSQAGGAGNLYSTVADLHRWNRGIFAGQILNSESLQLAHTVNPVPEAESIEMPYGYGWMMDQHRGLKRISHSGGLQGFVSQLSYYPEVDVTVVALHNAFPSVAQLAPGAVAEAMAEAFLWQQMESRPKYELAQVDPATYADFVGQYDYRGGILTVTREGDKLMAQITGQPKHEIFPAGDDTFFWKVVDAQVGFIRDSAGKVVSARHAQGIVKFVAPRIKQRTVAHVPAEILDRYVGTYRYTGLGELVIRRDGDRLFAQMQGQPELEIYPESETSFFWRVVNAQLHFEVDQDGAVVAATHHQAGQELPVKKLK